MRWATRRCLLGAGERGDTSSFQNEVLATGFNLPTSMLFLPDGRMLVTELPGTIKLLSPPYTSVSSTPFLQLTNVGNDGYAGLQQGIFSSPSTRASRPITSTTSSTRRNAEP